MPKNRLKTRLNVLQAVFLALLGQFVRQARSPGELARFYLRLNVKPSSVKYSSVSSRVSNAISRLNPE